MRKNIKGQVIVGEHVIVLFIAIGVASAMTIFFRRAVQAKIKSSRDLMANQIIAVGNEGDVVGRYYIEYEPYYAETEAVTDSFSESKYKLNVGGVSGAAEKTFNDRRSYTLESATAPPGETN